MLKRGFSPDAKTKNQTVFNGIECHDFSFFLFSVFVQKFNNVIFNAFDTIIVAGNLRIRNLPVSLRGLILKLC
jgi:hypothetical protein